MLDFMNWTVDEVIINGANKSDATITATLVGEIDHSKSHSFVYCNELMDDLRERLYTQPTDYMEYCKQDVLNTKMLFNYFYGANAFNNPLKIKRVIFNNPATIIFWGDGNKTVVKAQNGEPYDPEKGFVMAYLKRLLGNDNTFNKVIHKWVKE